MSGNEAAARAVNRVLLPAIKLPVGNGARQLEKRFNYLWQAAHATIATCASVAHQMSASMVQIARLNRVALPDEVLDYVCERCGGLLVPTVSADVRVVPMAPKAAANRKLALQRRRNKRLTVASAVPEVITSALHANLRAGATMINKPKSKKEKGKKRALDEPGEEDKVRSGLEHAEPALKRTKIANDGGKESGVAALKPPALLTVEPNSSVASVAQQKQTEKQVQPSVLQSVTVPPPASPPRKLLDGPKRKKKRKKSAAVDPAVAAAKSSLNSFLQSLRPGMSK